MNTSNLVLSYEQQVQLLAINFLGEVRVDHIEVDMLVDMKIDMILLYS